MIKYALSALALKVFSLNNHMMRAYRALGNIVGNKKRQSQDISTYVERGNLLLSLCKKYGPLEDQNKLFEIGTGWVHWYSIYIRMFHDVRITMLDIWDNRQFEAFKAAFSRLSCMPRDLLAPSTILDDPKIVGRADTFDELYDTLGLTYIIEKNGSLSQFPSDSFDVIFSFHVLEHILIGNVSELICDIYRLLKPGGLSIHQIGIDDHLSHYDKAESPKKYLQFSDITWKMFFQNKVQFFNRLQLTDWLNCWFIRLTRTSEYEDGRAAA